MVGPLSEEAAQMATWPDSGHPGYFFQWCQGKLLDLSTRGTMRGEELSPGGQPSRRTEGLCRIHPLRFSKPIWIHPQAMWSELIAEPAFSRRLEQGPPEVPSNLRDSDSGEKNCLIQWQVQICLQGKGGSQR